MKNAHLLLDLPAFPEDGHARLADTVGGLMGWDGDLVWVQAEAILALEAVATSLGRPAARAVNIVTSPYGRLFGHWLRRAGCVVHEVTPPAIGQAIGQAIEIADVVAAIGERADLVAFVHAESASGILNPFDGIVAAARSAGALVVVDAVASFGGHEVAMDGVDVAVFGAQKALDGPAGLSAVTVSDRAWAAMADAPVDSALSLTDLRRDWLRAGRRAVPGMPSALEWWALDAALARVAGEGLPARLRRHALARDAARAALDALGLPLWVEDATTASRLVTTARAPRSLDIAALARATTGGVDAAVGAFDVPVLRFNHTGRRAAPAPMARDLAILSDHLGLAPDDPRRLAATAALTRAWADGDL
jgi:aspartate aminotransferase-like enzyme